MLWDAPADMFCVQQCVSEFKSGCLRARLFKSTLFVYSQIIIQSSQDTVRFRTVEQKSFSSCCSLLICITLCFAYLHNFLLVISFCTLHILTGKLPLSCWTENSMMGVQTYTHYITNIHVLILTQEQLLFLLPQWDWTKLSQWWPTKLVLEELVTLLSASFNIFHISALNEEKLWQLVVFSFIGVFTFITSGQTLRR